VKSLYEWLWKHTTKKPFTKLIRETWWNYELLWIFGILAVGAVLGHFFSMRIVLIVVGLLAVGAVFGHLFWGDDYMEAEK